MPRIYQSKTDRGLVPHEQMIAAVEQMQAGDSIRKVAERFGITKSTLQRNVKKLGNDPQVKRVPMGILEFFRIKWKSLLFNTY